MVRRSSRYIRALQAHVLPSRGIEKRTTRRHMHLLHGPVDALARTASPTVGPGAPGALRESPALARRVQAHAFPALVRW